MLEKLQIFCFYLLLGSFYIELTMQMSFFGDFQSFYRKAGLYFCLPDDVNRITVLYVGQSFILSSLEA